MPLSPSLHTQPEMGARDVTQVLRLAQHILPAADPPLSSWYIFYYKVLGRISPFGENIKRWHTHTSLNEPWQCPTLDLSLVLSPVPDTHSSHQNRKVTEFLCAPVSVSFKRELNQCFHHGFARSLSQTLQWLVVKRDWLVLIFYVKKKSDVDIISGPRFWVYSNGIDLIIEVNKNTLKAQNLTMNNISSISGYWTNTQLVSQTKQ